MCHCFPIFVYRQELCVLKRYRSIFVFLEKYGQKSPCEITLLKMLKRILYIGRFGLLLSSAEVKS